MPHLRFRALKPEHVEKLSVTLATDLAKAASAPEDHFTFEFVPTQFYVKGLSSESDPFIEVLWFPRTPEIQDRCARIITDQIKALGPYENVIVVFHELSKPHYYENGTHF
jgi:hypothetical protein